MHKSEGLPGEWKQVRESFVEALVSALSKKAISDKEVSKGKTTNNKQQTTKQKNNKTKKVALILATKLETEVLANIRAKKAKSKATAKKTPSFTNTTSSSVTIPSSQLENRDKHGNVSVFAFLPFAIFIIIYFYRFTFNDLYL